MRCSSSLGTSVRRRVLTREPHSELREQVPRFRLVGGALARKPRHRGRGFVAPGAELTLRQIDQRRYNRIGGTRRRRL